ncbi:unnamed protein product [Hydatigera taeniaeformis]|uniref:RNA polymerase-associated protein LEO1 n=1 Tax=Hydatigena taeniaeformis TaxID=6205 RepID=A0A0R3WIY4_HYDTA|nr:unnamed protein product [Hydatigera taeniaeformis]
MIHIPHILMLITGTYLEVILKAITRKLFCLGLTRELLVFRRMANGRILAHTAVTTKDILGSSSSESESEDDALQEANKGQSLLTSTDESIPGSPKEDGFIREVDFIGHEQGDHRKTATEEDESDEIRIAADFPPIRADLGKEMYLVKMPNFLSVETRPFDPSFYEGELDEDEILDEEGRTRLKLKVENTIRWRLSKNANNNVTQESNARIVRWSDGSLSLHLGDEIFDVHKMDIQSDFNHLFIREDRGLQGQAIFRSKLSFRPHSTDSFTHRKMTLSLADKTSKSQKVKILPVAGADPESNRSLAVRKEEERLRVALRRESQQRRMQERQLAAASAHRQRRSVPGPSGYESFGDSDADNTVSLSAIKRNAKAGFLSSSQKNRGECSLSSFPYFIACLNSFGTIDRVGFLTVHTQHLLMVGRSVSDSDDASVSDVS